MQQVNVFIETSSRFRGNVERKCGYVLSTQLRTGKETTPIKWNREQINT